MVNQHENHRDVYGRKASHFEPEKRKKIDQTHWTNHGQSKHDNLECSEKETTGVLSNGYRADRPRKTTETDDRIIVRGVKRPPKISATTSTVQG